MTRVEIRNEKKKFGKDFASFCQILNRYFPDFSSWLASLKDPRKFFTYETELMLMTVIMKKNLTFKWLTDLAVNLKSLT